MLTGFAGGLVSSTAVTLSLARLAPEAPGRIRLLVAGIAAASATMAVRVLVVVGLLNWDVLQRVFAPLALAGGVYAALSFWMARAAQAEAEGESELDVRNPFDLPTVLKFGALLTAITFAAKLATASAGQAGAYALSAVSGLADVDAITLSMSQLGGGTISPTTAANAILIAVTVNTFAKVVLGWLSGGARLGRWLLLQSVLAVTAGLIAFVAVSRG